MVVTGSLTLTLFYYFINIFYNILALIIHKFFVPSSIRGRRRFSSRGIFRACKRTIPSAFWQYPLLRGDLTIIVYCVLLNKYLFCEFFGLDYTSINAETVSSS
jgi:hypothetical protein